MSTEIITNESIKSNTEDINDTDNPMNYKTIVDMLREMESQYNMLREMGVSSIQTAYDLKPETLTDIIPLTKEDIENMSEDDMKKFIIAHKYNPTMDSGFTPLETMLSVKETSMNILSTKLETEKIRNDSKEILNEYFEYASSKKAAEIRQKRVNMLREAVEKETDENKKRTMQRELDTIEAANTLSFIFRRFENIGEKEIHNIKKAFFDDSIGRSIVKRYKAKITKFGFDEKLYSYFLNLEENFLGEEYYCFNNLFLFIFMRMLIHFDPYNKSDKLYVQALISSMSNLVYHRFDDYVNEEGFINIIKRVDNYFECYREYFLENNTTSPIHPTRIKADADYAIRRKEAIITKMDELKITGYDPDASADDLQKYMNDSLEEMIKKQMPASEKSESDNVESTIIIEENNDEVRQSSLEESTED